MKMEKNNSDTDYEYMLQGLFHHASEQQKASDESLALLQKATADIVTQRKELDKAIAASKACEFAMQRATSNVGTDIKDAVNKAVTEAAHSAVSKAADAALKPMADSVKAAGQTLNAAAKGVVRGLVAQGAYVMLGFGCFGFAAYALPTWQARLNTEALISITDAIPCPGGGICVAVDAKKIIQRLDGTTIAKVVKMPGLSNVSK